MRSAIIAGALVAGLALSACSSGEPTTAGGGKPVEGQTLTMALGSDPGNLDPQFTSLSITKQVDEFLYDSLVNLDQTGKQVAGLAEKWEGTTTTAKYTLRKGVTCLDGSPLTATTVADNLNFVGNPASKSTRIGVFVPAGVKAVGDD
ncbi:MAG: peptide/nickel transport system substrate-binding protein, partial [Kribbellaceae bacterium]|nr:peptide/nickel transport system substrate-binding protein [Kribbellaceae bacterium]